VRGKVVLDSGFGCGHSNMKRVGLVLAVQNRVRKRVTRNDQVV
jgi:hypothetical protein